jgi:hypothetical protein
MQSKQFFEKIDGIFCDGIIIPRLKTLLKIYKLRSGISFSWYSSLEDSSSIKERFLYVRLLDSVNAFTVESIVKLNTLIKNLRKKLQEKDEKQEVIDGFFF